MQEAGAVPQLTLLRVISQDVELLQYQGLDYQDRQIGKIPTLNTPRAWRGGVDPCRKRLEIHMFGQAH